MHGSLMNKLHSLVSYVCSRVEITGYLLGLQSEKHTPQKIDALFFSFISFTKKTLFHFFFNDTKELSPCIFCRVIQWSFQLLVAMSTSKHHQPPEK